jgi:iron complex outermembrane receptor protein
MNAPIVDSSRSTASGRYDHYSSGQSNFLAQGRREIHADQAARDSRHLLARLPHPELRRSQRVAHHRLRAAPAVGSANIPAAFLAQYGANCTATAPRLRDARAIMTAAIRYGLTTLASPELEAGEVAQLHRRRGRSSRSAI